MLGMSCKLHPFIYPPLLCFPIQIFHVIVGMWLAVYQLLRWQIGQYELSSYRPTMTGRDRGENVTHVLRFPESGRGAAAQFLQEVLREGAGRQVTLQGDERHVGGCSLFNGQ